MGTFCMQRVEEHQQRRRLRHRQSSAPALGPPPSSAVLPHAAASKPSFRIGGKTDPGRFVSQHQQHFLILGFHDDERSDHRIAEDEAAGDDVSSAAPELLSSAHPLRLNFGRNTLSPVREHHDGLGGGGGGSDGDLVALMRQRVMKFNLLVLITHLTWQRNQFSIDVAV